MRATAFHEGRLLAEDELLAAHERCPLCDAGGPRRAVHRIQDAPVVDLLACGHCHGASASRMPRPEVLDAYYASYYTGTELNTTTPNTGRLAAAVVRRLPTVTGPVRVLDFGGGDGSVGAAVAARLGAPSAEVVVVDYGDTLVAAPAGVRLARHEELADASGPFAVVLASAVLEHVPAFRATFAQLWERVAPGGSLYVRTPWLAPFRRAPGGLDLTYPAHVHDLGGGFWNRAPATLGLDATLVRSGPSPVEADLRTHPARALAAAALKLPARAEAALRTRGASDPLWRWVGGWEAVLRRA